MAEFICTLIFKISSMHVCIPVVCINVCGRGEGVGWVVDGFLCGCVSEMYMYKCACVLIAVFLMCLNLIAYFSRVCVCVLTYIYIVCV